MMRGIGLGPVFELEWLTTARKWQVYAGRALFVSALLAGIMIVSIGSTTGASLNTRGQARIGKSIFGVIVVTQLVLVLLAAPAATAGSICLDKARGNLAHLFATDLSDAEIVLGKLAARLAPVLACVFCTLPVMAISTLIGGIDPVDLTGAFIITLAVAVLGCAVAMFLSVWASKSHEVMMGTCLVWAAWLLLAPMWQAIDGLILKSGVPDWINWSDLFAVALGMPGMANRSFIVEQLLFAGGLLAVSALLVGVTILRMRRVAIRQMGRGEVRNERQAKSSARSRISLPGPTLDGNPVLWREWHRQRPSRWVRVVGTIYYFASGLFSALAVYVLATGNSSGEFCALIVAFSVSVGMLLVAVRVPSALVEERVRGSLDVLMATPMTTRDIVEGKWWGAFRSSAALAILPGIVMTIALIRYIPSVRPPNYLRIEMFLAPGLIVLWIVSYATFLTSLGLALATWLKKPGRATALTISVHVLLTLGLPVTLMGLGISRNDDLEFTIVSGSSFWGPGLLTVLLERSNGMSGSGPFGITVGVFLWSTVFIVSALVLLAATITTFDRCMGRSTLKAAPIRDARPRKPAIPALVE
jgi:ABC-type transport system involved in multi-copper enzyme maturation permease subunit